MNKLGLALMVLGVLAVLGGFGYYQSHESPKYCLEFREKALALATEAVAAAGTPREQELMAEAEGESAMADSMCESADQAKQESMMIAGGGVLLLVVGFVLSRRKPAAPAA
jgi:hypothetical protein